MKRSCSTRLSYGPPDLEPTGFEPATTSLKGCSSTCIHSVTHKRAPRLELARLASSWLPRAGDLNPSAIRCSPASIRGKLTHFLVPLCNDEDLARREQFGDVVSPAFATQQKLLIQGLVSHVTRFARAADGFSVAGLRTCGPNLRCTPAGIRAGHLPFYCWASEIISISFTQYSAPA